ncbi:MAG: hypothetical protein P0116_17005 [Candidatus Nitrosocosmicus sp.]|nr:hypothetical protein [Candidatus Nitrosocosmicus sp.]
MSNTKVVTRIFNAIPEPASFKIGLIILTIPLLFTMFLFSFESNNYVVGGQSTTDLPWITEEWIDPNYKGINFDLFKVVINCQDSDNNCANNILTGQGIKDVAVYASPTILCVNSPDDPCYYGKSSNIIYSGGNKATIKVLTDPQNTDDHWMVELFYVGSTLRASFTIQFGCSSQCQIASTGIVTLNLQDRKSASELIVKTKIINDQGGSARPSDFNTYLYHRFDCGIGLCGVNQKDQIQLGKEDGSVYKLK